MKSRKLVAAVIGTLLGLSAPALAQSVTAAGLKVGAVVYGPEGNEVGKIERIDGEIVTVNTGTHTAALASGSFGKGAKGPVIGYTRAKLEEVVDAASQQAKAKLDAALTVGSALRSADGKALGAVEALNADGSVLIKGTDRSFSLNRDLFAADDQGLMLRITAQQLADAMAKSAPAPASN